MKIKAGMEELYQKGLDNNQDSYGRAVYTYAERWAELLEKDIEESGDAKTAIVVNAKMRSHEADVEGITGFMYGCAVSILSEVWEYGEILRKWHNKKYEYDGDGTVNPAFLRLDVKK